MTSPAAKVCLAAGSFLFTYLVCDLTAGVLLIRPLSPQLMSDPVVHHTPVPNAYSRIRTRDFDHVHRSNNLGLRGRDVKPEKPGGTYRIAMLGDSFTMGKGVEDDETFSHLLESRLNADPESGTRVEVLNAGVDSYSTLASYVQLRERLAPLAPDLVVLNFDMSDPLQEWSYRRAALWSPDGEVLAIPGPEDDPVEDEPASSPTRRWIDRHHYVTRWLVARFEKPPEWSPPTITATVRRKNRKILIHTLEWDAENRTEEWNNVFDSLRRIRDFCAANGMDFMLTVYPWGHQVHEREWAEGRKAFIPEGLKTSDRSIRLLGAFAAQEGIDFVNVFGRFRAYRDEALLYYEHDMHWTAAGHRVMADALEPHLRQRISGRL